MAKGLLLKGDKNLELVLLCSNKPSVTLLKQVAEKLTAQLEVELMFYVILHENISQIRVGLFLFLGY